MHNQKTTLKDAKIIDDSYLDIVLHASFQLWHGQFQQVLVILRAYPRQGGNREHLGRVKVAIRFLHVQHEPRVSPP